MPAKDNQIRYLFEYPERIRHYFQRDSLQIQYECPIADLPEGILMIPAVAQVAPLAWITNSNINVTFLEASFFKGLKAIQRNIKSFLPALNSQSKIFVNKIDHHKIPFTKTALLYTGGLDSVSALKRHNEKINDLIYLRGADIPLQYHDLLDQVVSNGRLIAVTNKMNYHIAVIDIWNFFNMNALDKDFKELLNKDWWEGIQFGISLLGAACPVCVNSCISDILISSSLSTSMPEMHGSHPMIDENFHWGENSHVHHVDYDLTRQEKIHQIIKPLVEDQEEFPLLKVCTHQWESYNCCECEKCCRTICGLLVENIDPNRCGFLCFGENTLHHIKENLVNGYFTSSDIQIHLWKDIQLHVHKQIIWPDEFIREFIDWFGKYHLHKPIPPNKIRLALSRVKNKIAHRVKKINS